MVVAMSGAREVELDARGRLCPQPILDLSAAVEGLAVGGVIRILSDDAAIRFDLPAWCQSNGHELLDLRPSDGVWVGRVRKMHDRAF
jgi:TusA-related sulfurtransferase